MSCPVISLIFTFSLMLVATYWISKYVSYCKGQFSPSFSWAFQTVGQYSLVGFYSSKTSIAFDSSFLNILFDCDLPLNSTC